MVDVVEAMVSMGTTEEVMVTEALLGLPTWYEEFPDNETSRVRSDSTVLLVTVGIATSVLVSPAGMTMPPLGSV